MKLSDYVMNFIKEQGVDDVFMLPGGGAIHLIDSLGKSKLNYICNLHEQASSISAGAYSEYTNNLGVCLITTGPGGTNTITGVAGAWLDSIPVLFISGQVQTKDINTSNVRQIGFQEINIVDIVKPITKYAVTVTNPLMIRYHLERAIYTATHGRKGPVWIDIPLDVQATNISPEALNYYREPEITKHSIEDIVSEIIADLNNSKKPIILAGNGIRSSKAINDFLELIDILKIPVLTTWKAIDFLEEEHPLYVGRPGGVGQRGANFSQQNSDFFISIGARLDHGQIAYKQELFAPKATKVIVDIDCNEISKFKMDIKYKITSDARNFIKEFIKQKNKVNINCENWLSKCKHLQEKYPVCLPEYWKENDHVNNYVFIEALSKVLPEGSLVIPGSSGCCSEVTMQTLKMKKGMRVFNTEGLGSMGFGIPAAIGACIASGKQETICIDGDGGFVMNIQELETVRRLNLPIKFFVINNNGYVSIRNTQDKHFNGVHIASDNDSGLTLPSWSKIANAFDITYIKIDSHNKINEQIKLILDSSGPVICDVKVSYNHITAPKVSVQKNKDGSFSARPMEDMEPFIDRKEFEENMSDV